MVNKAYEFICDTPTSGVIKKIEALFKDEGVEFRSTTSHIESTSTPIAILSLQPQMYSRKNWLGFNPFSYISNVSVDVNPTEDNYVKVVVVANRRRAYFYVTFFAIAGLSAARAISEPAGMILFILLTLGSWLLFVSLLGGHLVRKEIGDALMREE
jgi:hypothetical protein